jgi:diacylglycerol kinase (CTP)
LSPNSPPLSPTGHAPYGGGPTPSAKLRGKADMHWPRKIWHFTGIIIMLGIYHYFGPKMSWWILGGLMAFFFPLDYLRKTRPSLNAATFKVFGPLMRQHETNRMSGLSYLLFGAAILLAFFDRHIITLSLLFLAVGDPVASYFGIRFGRDKLLGNKTLQGTLAAFLACTLIASVYYYLNGLMLERIFIVAPVSGLIAAATELVPIGKLDDNLTCPVLSAIGLTALFYIYGGLGT